MTRNSILLGQYIKGHSYLHSRDPRGKLAFAVLSLGLVLSISSPLSFALLATCYLALAFASRVSVFVLLRTAKPVLFLAIFTFAIHCFFSGGTMELGATKGLFFSLRLIFMALFSGLFTATTTPEKIATSLTCALKPFSRFFDIESFAIMISLALRFIPIISRQTRQLIFAQASRGVDFKAKRWSDRLKAYASVLAPEFLLLFSHADKLALAMESRGFVPGAKRTSLHPLKWTEADSVFLALIIFSCLVIFLCDRWCFA